MSKIVIFCCISGIINFLTALLLGCFLLIKSYRIKANRYFAYFCFCVAFWSFFYFIWLLTPNVTMAEFYLRTCMLGVFFIPGTLFDFVTNFLKRPYPIWFKCFNYAIGLLGAIFVYTPVYAYDYSPFIGFYWLKPGPLFHVIILHFALLSMYTFWCLWYSYHFKVKEKGLRHQIRLILIALTITYVGGCTNYFMWYRIPFPPVANITVAGYVLMITYAILRYQLLDIKVVIKNSLIYSFLISIITILYFTMIYLSEQYLKGAIGYHSTIASLATAFLVALFFIPVKNLIQSLVEKYIFKATYIQIAEQNERLRRQVMISERYKTFSEIAKSLTVAIRDPLTTLKTYSYHFPKHYQDQAFLEKFNAILNEQIQKIQTLTEGLNKYSAADPLTLKKIDVFLLIKEVLGSIQVQITDQKINLNKYFPDSASYWINADSEQLKQVLIAFFLRAIKSMPQGGQLWVESELKENFFVIIIKDTGIAIPKQELEKIFDPFWRYHNENTGLDLAIAFSIIENHGGKVLVESSPEKGNEFVIQLPII